MYKITKNIQNVQNNVNSVICPDGASQCPDGNTCCKLSSGQYGCCPIPKAVCCSDHLHCCPSGTTCDVSAGKCNNGKLSLSWYKKTAASKVKIENNDNENSVVCPGGSSQCPDGSTCCKLSSGQYGCCPIPNAVCCSDHLHCCPSGTTCDVAAGKCNNGKLSFAWYEKTAARKVQKNENHKENSVVCPGGASQCPDGNTCCKLSSGQYGCCPIPKAVCCSDHLHCCPSGTTCDVSAGKCNNGKLSLSWYKKTAARKVNKNELQVSSVICPDGKLQCADGNTCCLLPAGRGYGCCPIPKAVCCSDHIHCCPEKTTCDLAAGKCLRKDNTATDWFKKVPASHVMPVPVHKIEDVFCPDKKSQCPDGNTCCILTTGQYGCCPKPNAVCCSDHIHCCPSGTSCDVSQGKCLHSSGSTTWLVKKPAKSLQTEVKANGVICPDQKSECPDGSTCCELTSGQWGCCPEINAVCCSDHFHCCPTGTKCDVSQGRCLSSGSIPLLKKIQAKPIKALSSVDSVICPGGSSECPNGNTCCRTSREGYSCCPVPNAVCCADRKHCCPESTKCDNGRCIKTGNALWYANMLAQPTKTTIKQVSNSVGSIKCSDSESCPDRTTCCKMKSGEFGCCPMPKAVCCSDGVHCCPNGNRCDLKTQTCVKGEKTIPMSKKTVALKLSSKNVNSLKYVVCPDKTSMCPEEMSCCEMKNGYMGCCPLKKSVCCSDKLHCCPEGSICDVKLGGCLKEKPVDWTVIPTPKDTYVKRENKKYLKCPDGKSECPDDTTCCMTLSQEYGCCPMKNTEKNDVLCPDGSSTCPGESTCCKLDSGEYGCCPLPKAVCCSDHVHCCPSGTVCDVSGGKCNNAGVLTDWVKKVPAKLKVDVVCEDGKSVCPEGTTCCKLPTGTYGCCPFPKASCCDDKIHCCPEGSKCDSQGGKCIKSGDSVSPFTKIEKKKKNVKSVVCPGGGSECPNDSTCCKMAAGQWGCCPIPNAVCCSDLKHCCPKGFKCINSQCTNGKMELPWVKKFLAKPVPEGHDCGDNTVCSFGQTCCRMRNGKQGCCPVQNAQCCKDGLHCCPEGTECSEKDKKCTRKGVSIPWIDAFPSP